MDPHYEDNQVKIYLTNARQIPLEDESVQTVVTSPPYWGLRDYGIKPSVWDGQEDCVHEWGNQILVNATNHTDKRRWNHTRNGRDEEQPIEKRVAWLRTDVDQGNYCQKCSAWRGTLGLEPTPELYVKHIVDIFREVRRVLRKDATVWCNLGDSYQGGNRGGYERERAGVSKNLGSGANGSDFTKAPNRFPIDGLKPKDLVGIPWRVAFALQADGWYLRSDIIWAKPNSMPESVKDRPTKAHEYIFLLAKSEKYFFNQGAVREPWADDRQGRDYKTPDGWDTRAGSHGTFHNDGREKGHKNWRPISERNRGGRTDGFTKPNNIDPSKNGGRNLHSVWTFATQPYPEAHFATFPEELAKRCILAGSRPGDTVLDPFCGSGTTLFVAKELGRKAIGIELKAEYIELSKNRLKQEVLNL